MANTTYTVPLQPLERTQDIFIGVGIHLLHWSTAYNANLISVVRVGGNVEYTFSNPIPQAERDALRMSV